MPDEPIKIVEPVPIGPEVNEKIGEYLTRMLNWLSKQKSEPITIVETGTLRDTRFDGHEDGLSTYVFAKWIKESGVEHKFYTIDLDLPNSRRCEYFLREQELHQYVTRFGWGDANLLLEHFTDPIDFAYLDAGADSVQTLHQYMRVIRSMREPGIIVVDDTFDSRNASKGLLTVPIAKLAGKPVASLMGRMAVIGIGANIGHLEAIMPKESEFILNPSLDPRDWKRA